MLTFERAAELSNFGALLAFMGVNAASFTRTMCASVRGRWATFFRHSRVHHLPAVVAEPEPSRQDRRHDLDAARHCLRRLSYAWLSFGTGFFRCAGRRCEWCGTGQRINCGTIIRRLWAIILRLVQRFQHSKREEFIALEKEFAQLEHRGILPRGERLMPILGRDPGNTIIWQRRFENLAEAEAALKLFEQSRTHPTRPATEALL